MRLKLEVEKSGVELSFELAKGEEEKNPKDCFGVTNLHIAVKNGHSKVCKVILDMVEDKNPKDHAGINPLSLSLIHDQENVCIEILKNFDYKNPPFRKRSERVGRSYKPIPEGGNQMSTLLHKVAGRGWEEACEFILKNVHDQNPKEHTGETPLHYAAQRGHCSIQPLEIDRLFIGNSGRFVETRLRVYQDLKFRKCKQREIPACDSRN